MNERQLLHLIDGLARPRVLIVGDLILDRYLTGDVERISPEAPIPVLATRHDDSRLGGAGNVAANLRAMEAEVELVGVVGDDGSGRALCELLEGIGVDTDGCATHPTRRTTVKIRLVSGVQQILRVDQEDGGTLDEDVEGQLLAGLEARVARAGAVVLSDYGKGVVSDAVVACTVAAARSAGVPVLVDPKGSDYARYAGATLVTPNRKEAELALGRPIDGLDALPDAADELIRVGGLSAAVVTLGADGMYYRSADATGRVPALARQVFDVTGAGDTVIAHLALALAAGESLEVAVHLANRAAGLVVGRRGAASVTRDELRGVLGGIGDTGAKVVMRDDLPAVLAEWRAEGKRIVFTNGCFDVLHAGHVEYLRFARTKGDVLLVGVNDDASVARLKGEGRPVNELADRQAVLAALEMVDGVTSFGEDTPAEIVEAVTPDVLVKGEDWRDKGVVGREWVERHGGEVHLAPLLPGRSTSAILEGARTRPERGG